MTWPDSLKRQLDSATDAIDVVVALAQDMPGIRWVTLIEQAISPAERATLGKHPDVQRFVPDALALRSEFGVPFWMAVMFVATSRIVELPHALIKAASYHTPRSAQRRRRIEVSELSPQFLRSYAESLDEGSMITLSSRVEMETGEHLHIPMLDLRVRSGQGNLASVEAMLSEIGVAGVVLDSGNSYHFYGATLMTDEALTSFLGSALLFTPLVDYRWIAHQLIEGSCALRIARNEASNKVPQVQGTVGP